MSTEKPLVTIVGLGLVGASIGMALRKTDRVSAIVGHDKDSAVSAEAKKLGAVDKTDWLLLRACEKADLVILALPVAGIKETLQAIGTSLRAGCVVLDTASLKAPVLTWADEILPANVHFVGGDPILGGALPGQGPARADLFQNVLFCLMPSQRADPAAIQLAIDLVTILGAKPLFHDPLEHDGLIAAVEQLPSLLALALLDNAVSQPMWRELRKLAGSQFETVTASAVNDPLAFSQHCLLNRDNVVRWIDSYTDSLASIRDALVQDQSEALVARWQAALMERDRWLQLRAQADWDEVPRPDLPRKQSLLQPFLGGLATRKPKSKS